MRKFALLAASSAGALFTIEVAAPNRVDAMTFSKMASALDLLATADTVKPEQVRWCRARDCRTRYYEPRPSYWVWGWYRPWPYYPYYNLGTGQSNFGFSH
jgi:hypothetical protein